MKQMLSLLMACLITIGAVPHAAAASGYADVSESAWYADAVEYVTDIGSCKVQAMAVFHRILY